VRTMRSYPVAFDQCRDLIHSLSVRCLPSATTADAAREVAESEDPTEAAIASVEAAQIYGLQVIAEDVGDRPAAFTRFVALGPYTRLDVQNRCRTGKVTYAFSRKTAKGRVISQSRRPGRSLPAGTRIALVVSRGQAEPAHQSAKPCRFAVVAPADGFAAFKRKECRHLTPLDRLAHVVAVVLRYALTHLVFSHARGHMCLHAVTRLPFGVVTEGTVVEEIQVGR